MDERWRVDEGELLNARLFRAYFGDRPGETAPPFSSDLSAAWVLLEALRRRYGSVEVVAEADGGWRCHIVGSGEPSVEARAVSAPLAICAAAREADSCGLTARGRARAAV